MAEPMRTGDAVNVVVFSLDGTRRRWWTSTIESVDSRCVRTFSRLGNPVGGPKGGWASQADIRAFYWFDRHYNLLESYDAAGTLSEIYVHIASPAKIINGAMHYIDYELDVVRRAGSPLDDGLGPPASTDADGRGLPQAGHTRWLGIRSVPQSRLRHVTVAMRHPRVVSRTGPAGIPPRPASDGAGFR